MSWHFKNSFNKNKIILEELEVFAYHGLYPEESTGQMFNLSFILTIDFEKAADSDDINHTIDYDEFCGFVVLTFTKKRFNLLETATQFLAEQLILKFKQLQKVKITAYKPSVVLKSKTTLKFAKIEIEIGWHIAFLSLGSNLGNKLYNIKTAIEKLANSHNIKLKKTSTIEQTKAYGREMADFLNCAVEIETFASPSKLLQICNSIEYDLKRTRETKWCPRTIDIDILFYDNLVITTSSLTIPHYDIKNREFVLNPMVELSPNFIHPVFLKTMTELKDELKENQQS